jgi:methionyl aminopeptidase
MIATRSAAELSIMREAGRVTARALRAVGDAVAPGVTTSALDEIAVEVMRAVGARAAFLGYHGFPATICSSLNGEVVHGIPGRRKLEEGDILSVDVGAVVDGYFGDAARTFPVGKVSDEATRLLTATRQALEAGIACCVPGMRLGDIGAAVQKVAEDAGFSIVREYVGHGIGRAMHEDPQVPNYGTAGKGPVLLAGMVLAIEPMVNAGGADVRQLADGWTVVTADSSLSAHFEHTIAITNDGPSVLTLE